MSWVISFAFTVHWFEGWCKHSLRGGWWSMKLSGNIVSVIFNVLSAFELTAKHTWYTLPFTRLVSHFVRFSFFSARMLKRYNVYCNFHKKIYFKLIIIRNVYWAANQYIRMISKIMWYWRLEQWWWKFSFTSQEETTFYIQMPNSFVIII